jgi:Dit-like phage tail protein
MGLSSLPGLLGTNPFNFGQNAAGLWRTLVTNVLNSENQPTTSAGWTPPQWNRNTPQITCISTTTQLGAPTSYFFDAVFKVNHIQEVTITKQPVQTGAPVADHSYMQPARVELEIGMSDTMSEYRPIRNSVGPKSVNAYRQFIDLQNKRSQLTLVTRLKTYENMVITTIRATDDKSTINALKATIIFEQIFPAQITSVALASQSGGVPGGGGGTDTSTRGQLTGNTLSGTLVAQDADVPDQYEIPYSFGAHDIGAIGSPPIMVEEGPALSDVPHGTGIPYSGTISSTPLGPASQQSQDLTFPQ